MEVGKFYNVTCAEIQYDGKIIFVPVVGEKHIDKQFGVPFEHIHIDGRFFNNSLNRTSLWGVDENGRTNNIIQTDNKIQWNKTQYYFAGIVTKRKKCVRLTTGIRPPIAMYDKQTGKPRFHRVYHDWYENFIGHSCAGKKCPHLGTTMEEKENGKLVCPLHNLIGDSKTNKIIPYNE